MNSNIYRPPLRDLLLVIVFQLGVIVAVLGDVATAARGYETGSTNLSLLVGTTTALGALFVLVLRRYLGIYIEIE